MPVYEIAKYATNKYIVSKSMKICAHFQKHKCNVICKTLPQSIRYCQRY